MKQILIAVIVLATVGFALADTTIPIVIVTADEARVFEAFGSILNLKDATGAPKAATAVEVQGAINQWLAGSTTDYEKRKNMQSFSPPPLEWTGTPIPAPSGIPEGLSHTSASKPTATPKKK